MTNKNNHMLSPLAGSIVYCSLMSDFENTPPTIDLRFEKTLIRFNRDLEVIAIEGNKSDLLEKIGLAIFRNAGGEVIVLYRNKENRLMLGFASGMVKTKDNDALLRLIYNINENAEQLRDVKIDSFNDVFKMIML